MQDKQPIARSRSLFEWYHHHSNRFVVWCANLPRWARIALFPLTLLVAVTHVAVIFLRLPFVLFTVRPKVFRRNETTDVEHFVNHRP